MYRTTQIAGQLPRTDDSFRDWILILLRIFSIILICDVYTKISDNIQRCMKEFNYIYAK